MFELYKTNPKSPADSVEKLYLNVVSTPWNSSKDWFVLYVVISS